jgi:branched-chain amino acid transport system permease protein
MLAQFTSLLFLGLGLGAVYAAGAVGLSLILRFSGILHFGHGASFILGSYTLLALARVHGMPLVISVLAAVVVATLTGVIVCQVVYRPLERRGVSELGYVISSFGVLIVVENAMNLAFGSTAQAVPLPSRMSTATWEFGAVTIRVADVLSVAVVAVAVIALELYRRRSRTGLLVRALERNRQLAADLGIRYSLYLPVVFAVGSALAGLSAVLSSLTVPIAPQSGLTWTVSVYIAMAVGGTGSVWGAASGAVVLGVLSTVPDLWISQSWNTAIAFGVLILALVLLPSGLVPGDRRQRRGGSDDHSRSAGPGGGDGGAGQAARSEDRTGHPESHGTADTVVHDDTIEAGRNHRAP